MLLLAEGRRQRPRMRNAGDGIHPVHRHRFELARIAGRPTAGMVKDVVMPGGHQEAKIDFVADDPGPAPFRCHQRPRMDHDVMALLDRARSARHQPASATAAPAGAACRFGPR